ncbi:MAG: hypothetical protein H8D70_00095 [Rhodospirillaceae bacterium]|nr:hypothetical protein [Rhodospirillaceae bacterium]
MPASNFMNVPDNEDKSERTQDQAGQAKWRLVRDHRRIVRSNDAIDASTAQIRADAEVLSEKNTSLRTEIEDMRTHLAKLDGVTESLRRSREKMLEVARMADDAIREIEALEKSRP